MNKENQHIGSSLNEFLEEEGLLETSQSLQSSNYSPGKSLNLLSGKG